MGTSKTVENREAYRPLAKDEEDHILPGQLDRRSARCLTVFHTLLLVAAVISAMAVSFIAGAYSVRGVGTSKNSDGGQTTAPRIPVPIVEKEFVYSSPFSEEPPQGEGAGHESEPIWDALIPNGLGYFRDGDLAPRASIPTVFHQLHCLYVIRRAYYSRSDHLEEFDFGKDRAAHAGHCFDYLQQSLTCSADSTVEPTEDDQDRFLGSGFPRQCRDFNVLKQYVEQHRVFNATGFLAAGLKHGKAHVGSS